LRLAVASVRARCCARTDLAKALLLLRNIPRANSRECRYCLLNFGQLVRQMYMHWASTEFSVGKPTRRWAGSVGVAAAVGSAYFLAAYLSLTGMFFLASEGITLFWAPAGISSGVLIALATSPARWPAVAGAFVAAFAVPFVILGRGIWLSTIFALCDTAEPLIIAGLIAHYF
jgi:hypothetical protein